MNWYKVAFASKEIADGDAKRMVSAFSTIFAFAGGPTDAALLTENTVPSTSVYYFSPGAVAIADSLIKAHAGVACPAPKRSLLKVTVAGSLDGIPFAAEE